MMFGRGYNGFMNHFGPGFMYGGWGMMIFMAVIFLLAIITVIYIIKRPRHYNRGDEALQALKVRFVKGEISEEEYIRKKNILE